jgi:type III secretory pathway component EscS
MRTMAWILIRNHVLVANVNGMTCDIQQGLIDLQEKTVEMTELF